MSEQATTLVRAATTAGEVVLRRRGDVVELIVNGVFAMDTVETTFELALADAAGTAPGRVLVGGLGLGFTAGRLLDHGAARVDVVELAAPLLDWARAGVTEQLGRVASDPRVALHAGDVADWMASHRGPWDAVLLDVDNGPGFLIHEHNRRLYDAPLLGAMLDRLAPDGVLVIWCEAPNPELLTTLRSLDAGVDVDVNAGVDVDARGAATVAAGGDVDAPVDAPACVGVDVDVEEIIVAVDREGRSFDYALYRARCARRSP